MCDSPAYFDDRSLPIPMNSLLMPVRPAPAPTGGACITAPFSIDSAISTHSSVSTASGLMMNSSSRRRVLREFAGLEGARDMASFNCLPHLHHEHASRCGAVAMRHGGGGWTG